MIRKRVYNNVHKSNINKECGVQSSNTPIGEEQKALAVIAYAGLQKSFFQSINCNIVLFQKEILHAAFTKKLLQQEIQRKKEEYMNETGSPTKTGNIRMGVTLYYYSKYFDLSPQEILDEHENNFRIPVQDILKITYTFDVNELQDVPPRRLRPGKLRIATSSKEYTYIFGSIPAKELLSALQEIWADLSIEEGKASWTKS
jgi:hypothetical protein